MARLKLSPPWVAYYKKLNALFGEDKDVSIVYDEDEMEVKIYCEAIEKSNAFDFLLPKEVSFGDVTLKVTVVPSNGVYRRLVFDVVAPKITYKTEFNNSEGAIQVLFACNKHTSQINTVTTPFGDFTYVIFKKEVIQYYEDNLSDFYGNRSTLAEAIAKEIFNDIEGVFFCTSNE